MDGRGGCCIARYADAGGYDVSQMDRIMLKFRPIAPKPPPPGVAPPCSDAATDGKIKCPVAGRGRRKIRRSIGRKRKSSSPDQKGPTTLSLLPEAPDSYPTTKRKPQSHCTLGVDPAIVGSYVIVEAVTTDTCPAEGVRAGDVRALEKDTCPVIVSDGWNYKVVWANEAYRRMVMGDTWRDQRMGVWVVMKEKVPDGVQAFTCNVRVQRCHGGRESRGSSSYLTLPCDVWRIDGGGFAWRLDVDAALCLGRALC